jgi:hypothetical protein
MPRFPFKRNRETEETAQAPATQGSRPPAPAGAPAQAGDKGPPPRASAGGDASASRSPAGPAAAVAAPKPAAPQPPDPHERIDSMRAWLAQLDRKLGVRTYLLAAIGLLALAAAVVALVLVLQLKRDAATKDDVDALQGQLTGVQQSATQAAQKGVRSVNQRLTDLQNEVSSLSSQQTTAKRELQVVQDDIKELRSQASSNAGSATGSGAGGGTGGALGSGAGGAGAAGGSGGTATKP